MTRCKGTRKDNTRAKGSYYVYRLVDPWSGATFYVGKGKGRRCFQHNRDAPNPGIRRAIRSIERAGGRHAVEIEAQGLSEGAALQLERGMIESMPGLANIAPGRRTPAEIDRDEARRNLRSLKRASALPAELIPAHRLLCREWGRIFAGLPGSGFTDAHKAALKMVCDYWWPATRGPVTTP